MKIKKIKIDIDNKKWEIITDGDTWTSSDMAGVFTKTINTDNWEKDFQENVINHIFDVIREIKKK